MKQSEIKNLSVLELQQKLVEFKKSLHDLVSAHAISPIQNPLQIRTMRRSVARVMSELTKRELQNL
jgi:large subunit ribosomal protein L29